MQTVTSKTSHALSARTRWERGGWLMLRGGAVLGGMMLAIVSCNAQPIAAYKVQPGDTIEISVAGFPELRQRVSVQPDGTIAFPLLGALNVAGLSSADLRQQVQAHLARKIYRQHTNDGREALVVIRPEEVSAAIVGYRPIYVSGDVTKPGELTFRPGITVREALALAGGYFRGEPLTPSVYLQAASVKGEYDLLRLDLARESARITRIKSELNGQDSISFPQDANSPLPPAKLAQINSFETDLLKARMADYHREHDFLQAAIKQADQQIAVLANQQKEEQAGAKSDMDDLKRMSELLKRGQVISSRVVEARRALLLSSTRTLQVTAQLLQLKKAKMESLHRLTHFEDDYRISLLKQLEDATQTLNGTRLKLEAAKDKLDYLSRTSSQPQPDRRQSPETILIRQGEKGFTRSTVNGDFALEPGDVIEVSLHPKDRDAMLSR